MSHKITPPNERIGLGRLVGSLGPPVGGGDGAEPPVDCCETDETLVPDRANGRTAWMLSTLTDVDLVQSDYFGNSAAFATVAVTLGADPVPGNVMVAVLIERTSGNPTDPSGWTLVPDRANKTGFGGSVGTMWYRIVQPGDGPTLTVTKAGSNQANLILMEFSGAGILVDSDDTDTTADQNNATVGPVTVDDDDSLVVAVFTQIGVPVTLTPGAGYTQVATDDTDGTDPSWIVEWSIAAAGSESTTTTSSYAGGAWSALLASFAHEGAPAWIVLAPRTVDDDDATYNDTLEAGTEHVRLDLGAEYRITRTRIRLGTTTSGSKTLTLKAWNELDQSDMVTVTTITFTATGTLTAQDVTKSWLTNDAYRYWQIDGPSEIVRYFSIEMYEPTLGESHEHSTIAEEAVRDAGRWETVTNGDVGSPECVYELGDIVVAWVSGP